MEQNTSGERISGWFHRVWRRGVMRSGLVTGLFLTVAAITFVLAYRQHMQGNFHKLKERMADERPQAVDPQPGGQEALELSRTRLMEEAAPEFLSVTSLPGRGMNVLQIRAYIPGKGDVDLLASPSVGEVTAAMTGKGQDAGGQASMKIGAAFEAPWADRIWNTASAEWHGRALQLSRPASPAEGGLMLMTPSDSYNTATLPDGGQAEAIFHGFGSQWPSKTEITATALLSSHTVDLTVTVRNAGDTAEPVGIGWMPRFAIPRGGERQMLLRVPGHSRVEFAGRDGSSPTGRLLPVDGSGFDYTARVGAKLPDRGLDECFADLEQGVLDSGPVAELSDAANGYRLRLTALSPEIKAMRVVVPADASFVSIGPQFNYPDPFGHEWDKAGGSGMVELQPGQSTEWKVRLEILPLNEGAGGP